MKGLLKWPGGKEREIANFIQYFPNNIDVYYEPFLGGGAVYMSTKAKLYKVNDLYSELIGFYRLIASEDAEFKDYLYNLNNLWKDVDRFMLKSSIIEEYILIRQHGKDKTRFSNEVISKFSKEIFIIYASIFNDVPVDFDVLAFRVFDSKLKRIAKHEANKGELTLEDLYKNLTSAMKSVIYTYLRSVYNYLRKNRNTEDALYISTFYFIRNYCYSSMFRFNRSGDFNVPYGGLSYNNNYLDNKLEFIFSRAIRDRLQMTQIDNLDFEDFMSYQDYGANDFIFLDPPYDTEFNNYADNVFNESDQRRLADLLKNIEAKWLMVSKRTPLIESLYSSKGIEICDFSKKYQVSFKERNDKNTQHLIIRNYI